MKTIVLLLCLALLASTSNAGSCSRCRKCPNRDREPERERSRIPVIPFTLVDPSAVSEFSFFVAAGGTAQNPVTQSWPVGTAGTSKSGLHILSTTAYSTSEKQRIFAAEAWTSSRSGTLKNLFVNVQYFTTNSSLIVGSLNNIANVTVAVYVAQPSGSFTNTGLSVETPINANPYKGQPAAVIPNTDVALSDAVDRYSIPAGTRVTTLISFAFTGRAVTSGLTEFFQISGSYEFD